MAFKGVPQHRTVKPLSSKQRANVELIKRGKIQEPIFIANSDTSGLRSWWTDPTVVASREAFDARVAQELDRMRLSAFGRTGKLITAADSYGMAYERVAVERVPLELV